MSLASVPEVVRKTFGSSMPDTAAICSASCTIGRFRYSVDVCRIRPAWSLTAFVTSGSACAVIVVRMPPKKSR